MTSYPRLFDTKKIVMSTHERRFAHNNIGHTVGVAAGTIGLLKANRFVARYGIPFLKKNMFARKTRFDTGRATRRASRSDRDLSPRITPRKTPVVKRVVLKAKRTRNYGRNASVSSQFKKLFGPKKSAARAGPRGNNFSASVVTRSGPSVGKKFKQADYQKHGSVICLESGGTQSDANCVYVGVGTPLQEYFYVAARSLVLALARKAGRDIANWNDSFGLVTVHQIDITYIPLLADTQSIINVPNIVASTTYQAVAVRVAQAIQVALPTTGMDVHWIEAILYEFTDALTKPIVSGIVSLQQFMIDIECGVSLNVQNQTPSDTSSTSTDVINSNPVRGKMYMVNGNHFEPKNVSNRIDPETSDQLLSGWGIATTLRGEWSNGSYDKATKKPPPASFFARIVKSESATIAPGECMIFKGSRTQTFSWTNLLVKLLITTAQDLDYVRNPLLGCSIMVAMEKVMDTRLTTEVAITLGYQCEVWLKGKHHYKKPVLSAVINETEPNDLL